MHVACRMTRARVAMHEPVLQCTSQCCSARASVAVHEPVLQCMLHADSQILPKSWLLFKSLYTSVIACAGNGYSWASRSSGLIVLGKDQEGEGWRWSAIQHAPASMHDLVCKWGEYMLLQATNECREGSWASVAASWPVAGLYVLSEGMGLGYCMCYVCCTMTCCSSQLKETSGLGVLHVLLLVPAKKFQQKQSGGKWNWKDAKSLFLSIPGTCVDIDLHACKRMSTFMTSSNPWSA